MAQAEIMDRETGEIVPLAQHQPMVSFDGDKIELIKNTIMPRGSSAQELELFLYQCKRTGLDPITRQIYALKVDNKVSVQVSIDGFRLIAERSGKYAGQLGPFWCGEDGVWQDVWLQGTPAACKVAVLRSDFKEPCWGVARFASYRGGFMWNKMPDLMIAKVAEALALRRAFPQELSGLYTSDEMQQAGGDDGQRSHEPPANEHPRMEWVEPEKDHRPGKMMPVPASRGRTMQEAQAATRVAPPPPPPPPAPANGAASPTDFMDPPAGFEPRETRADAVRAHNIMKGYIDEAGTAGEVETFMNSQDWKDLGSLLQRVDGEKGVNVFKKLTAHAEHVRDGLRGMEYGNT